MDRASSPGTVRRIEKLILRRFRGATTETEITFDKHKPLVLIFGENGSGKTSLVDAIDFVCNREFGSLSEKSSAQPKQHLPSIGCDRSEVSIELTLGGEVWRGHLDGKGIAVKGPVALPSVHILRRGKLVKLIEAPASERYAQLQRFIDVEGIEKSEQKLRDAVNDAKKRLDALVEQQQEAENTLAGFWSDEGSPGEDAPGWARGKLAVDQKAGQTAAENLHTFLNRHQVAAQAKENFSKAEANFRERAEALDELRRQAAEIESAQSGEGLSLIELLHQARDFIAAQSPESCPVCLQSIQAEQLREALDGRMKSLQSLRELQIRLKAAESASAQAEAQAEAARTQIAGAARALDQAFELSRSLIPGASAPIEKDARKFIDAFSPVALEAKKIHDELQRDLSQLNAIKRFVEQLERTKKQAVEEDRVLARLTRALNLVHQTRVRYVQQILDEVRDECQALYQTVHPGETIKLKSLQLDPQRKASLDQMASFEGFEDVPPQAYFSESHLDTLGFCLWLAVAKRSGRGSIVVLDDVFTSVDSAHHQRLLELLIKECDFFGQIFLTTHLRNWQSRLRNQLLPPAKMQLIELSGWQKDRGILSTRGKLFIDELKELQRAPNLDRRSAAIKTGVFLEFIFRHLAEIYDSSLPFSLLAKPELHVLYGAARKPAQRIEVQQPGKPTPGKISGLHEKLYACSVIRNEAGGHFNEDDGGWTEAEIRELLTNTCALIEELVCPVCGSLAHRKEREYFLCNCGQTRMSPVKI